jgi:hypothetical protein
MLLAGDRPRGLLSDGDSGVLVAVVVAVRICPMAFVAYKAPVQIWPRALSKLLYTLCRHLLSGGSQVRALPGAPL